jgi:hypothetical protein
MEPVQTETKPKKFYVYTISGVIKRTDLLKYQDHPMFPKHYRIEDDDSSPYIELMYVGSTIKQTPKYRFSEHKSNHKDKTRPQYYSSFIFDVEDDLIPIYRAHGKYGTTYLTKIKFNIEHTGIINIKEPNEIHYREDEILSAYKKWYNDDIRNTYIVNGKRYETVIVTINYKLGMEQSKFKNCCFF